MCPVFSVSWKTTRAGFLPFYLYWIHKCSALERFSLTLWENCSRVTFLQTRILRRIVLGFLSLLSFFPFFPVIFLPLPHFLKTESTEKLKVRRRNISRYQHFLKFTNKNHTVFLTWLLLRTWGQTIPLFLNFGRRGHPVILLYSAIFIPRILVIFGRKLFYENMFQKIGCPKLQSRLTVQSKIKARAEYNQI